MITFHDWLESIADRLDPKALPILHRGEATLMRFGRLPPAGRGGPAFPIADVCGLLASHLGSRYLKPGIAFKNEGETDLAACARWMPIKPASVAALTEELHFDLSHQNLPEIAQGLVQHLCIRDNARKHLVNPPPISGSEQRVLDAFAIFGDKINPAALTPDLIAKWGKETSGMKPHEIASTIRSRLKLDHFASKLTRDGSTLKDSDYDPADTRFSDPGLVRDVVNARGSNIRQAW